MFFNKKNLVLFFIVCAYFFNLSVTRAELFDKDKVVAIVNGGEIRYKKIKTDPAYIISYYRYSYGSEITDRELELRIRKAELRNLLREARNIINYESFSKLGIMASNEEVELELERRFKQSKINEQKTEEIYKLHHALVNALEALQKNPEDSVHIYKKKLAPMNVTPGQWELWQITYNTPEKIKELRVLLPKMKTVEGMKKISYESTKRDILHRKFREVVAKDVVVIEEELVVYYEKRYPRGSGPKLSKIKEQLKEELLERKKYEKEQEFLQKQYKKAKIEIKDERFKDVPDMLLPSNEEKKSNIPQ